jgi:hypothetical protein
VRNGSGRTPVNVVLDQVRAALAEAHAASWPRPGRPTLVKLTGATDHQVRKALAELAAEQPPAHQAGGGVAADTAIDAIEAGTMQPVTEQDGTRPLPRPWPPPVIGLAAAVAVWGSWLRLGELTGFGPVNVLPGIGDGLILNTAVVLPIS